MLSTSSGITLSQPAPNVGGSGGTVPLTIDTVIESVANPTQDFDIVGDGTGDMGTICSANTGASTTPGAGAVATSTTNCVCQYTWTSSGTGAQQVIEAPTIYSESNLLRCPYTSIPAGTASVQVAVVVNPSGGGAASNSITFTFGATASADPTNVLNFSQAQRYQCKDIVAIPYPFASSGSVINSMYDPIQSTDPSITYPLDFYTTNMGASFAAFAGLSNANGWDCPPLPNDTTDGMDLTIYSSAADANGSYYIYPPAGSAFDRSTFYLATQQAGVFNVPVDAYVAPTLTSCSNTATCAQGSQIFGYAASPQAGSTPGTESCPDSSTPIPAGFHWVKVWLFRADLQHRSYYEINYPSSFGGIVCDPGEYPGTATEVFPSCGGDGHPIFGSNSSLSWRALVLPSNASDTMCVQDTPGGTTTDSSGTLAYTNSVYDVFQLGTDTWTPEGGSCANSSLNDVTNLCSQSNDGGSPVPYFQNLTAVDLDANNSRYDFLFVVTPTTVMSGDMLGTSSDASSVAAPYTPYRFMSPEDCQSPDPNNPVTPGDCSVNTKITYALSSDSVNVNGDTSSTSPTQAAFPVCALQPD